MNGRVNRKLRTVETMMVFDLDGVVTDPTTTTNDVDREVIAAIASDLRARIPVAFNTGRTVQWVEERVLPLLRDLHADELSLLVIIGEKGGVVAEFDDRSLTTLIDKTLSLPAAFTADVLKVLELDRAGWKLSDSMFWDAEKITMGSIEKAWAGVELAEFHKRRETLITALEPLLQKHKLTDFKIDATVIATDIEHRTAGKHKGADQILDWLMRKHVSPKSFTAFGDSPSDAEMARAFSATGAPTTFVYVGNTNKYHPKSDDPYRSIIMHGNYSKDTVAYLTHPKV